MRIVTVRDGMESIQPPACHAAFDIVFVHGIGEDIKSTWTYRREYPELPSLSCERFWPDELRHFFQSSSILCPRYTCEFSHFFPQSSSNYASQTTIDDLSRDLLNAIVDERNALNAIVEPNRNLGLANECSSAKTTTRPIVFIAHSLGGLICANAVLNEDPKYRDIVESTRGFIFLGTPFGDPGDPEDEEAWVNTAEKLFRLFGNGNKDDIRDLKHRTGMARRVVRNFSYFLKSRPELVAVAFYLEESSEETVVESDFGVLPGYQGKGIVGDHISISKFEDIFSPGFKEVCRQILLWGGRDDGHNWHYLPELSIVRSGGRR